MPTIDNWRALREALEAMCRTVSLHDDEWESREGDTNEWGTLCYEIDCKNNGTYEIATAYGPTTADYIAAAHPAAIRSLLDERDRLAAEVEALRTDAERYRWLRHGDNDELCISFMSDGTPFMLRAERLDARIDSELENPPIVVAIDPNSDAAMKGKP